MRVTFPGTDTTEVIFVNDHDAHVDASVPEHVVDQMPQEGDWAVISTDDGIVASGDIIKTERWNDQVGIRVE